MVYGACIVRHFRECRSNDFRYPQVHRFQIPGSPWSVRVLAAFDALGLVVPTATLTHRIPGLRTIDHVAVP